MSSVTSAFAQVDRRVGYFITLAADISGYTIGTSTDPNAWAEPVALSATALQSGGIYGAVGGGSGKILEDMGELAKYGGQLYRKVRLVTQSNQNALPCFWILIPGGEYPVQGYPVAGGATGTLNNVSAVARLG